MIISSWNVNSVRARIENIKSYLLKYKPDILMMQEIKCEDVNFPYDDFSSLGYESCVFGQKSYNGVAIISKVELDNVNNSLTMLSISELDNNRATLSPLNSKLKIDSFLGKEARFLE